MLEVLRKIYRVDAECKKEGLSRDERLARHQRDSGPAMQGLKAWIEDELAQKRVEPPFGPLGFRRARAARARLRRRGGYVD